jgi:hypothetical protein
MLRVLRVFFDWSEVWALLFPLACMARARNQSAYLKPLRIYTIVALVINLASTMIWYRYRLGLHLPAWLDSNSFCYNAASIARLVCFSWAFILLRQRFLHRVKIILPVLFLLLTIVDFIFFEDFYTHDIFSTRLLASEAAILLFFCVQYYIFLVLQDRPTNLRRQPAFWFVTGLSFYTGISFFIFLFYAALADENVKFAVDIWDVHNVAYIFLCVCIGISFLRKENE